MLKGSLNVVTFVCLILTALGTFASGWWTGDVRWAALALVAGVYVSASPRIVMEWNRAILLRLGRFRGAVPPGLFWVIPGVDVVVAMVDVRVRSTSFSAEKTLTKDTVPVDVDAVLFWVVTDAKRAILEVERFRETVSWAAQTTLRDVIGKTELVRMVCDRETLDNELRTVIDAKTSEWGITVQSVEIRDVQLPAALEDAMSRRAQADREKEARVILAQSEVLVAEQMEKAAQTYLHLPMAMQLRAMNMTYESIKERGALMVIPTGMADSLNAGIVGVAAAGFRTQGGQS
jgi:regulator of protease activity HflC (stomatin/prohibitin superfamily)